MRSKKILKTAIANLLLLCSGFSFAFAGVIGFNNTENIFSDYLNKLTSNPYQATIVKATCDVDNKLDDEYFHKEVDTRAGQYSTIDASINDEGLSFTLIGTKAYTNDSQYNNFGVVSSYLSSGQTRWDLLDDSGCFVSREFSTNYAKRHSLQESDIIGKTIVSHDFSLTIRGIYYTNVSSTKEIEMRTRGNVFELSFENPIFVTNASVSTIEKTNSFLLMIKGGSLNLKDAFMRFRSTVRNAKGSVSIDDYVGDYQLDRNINKKLKSTESYYTSRRSLLSAAFIIFGILLFAGSIVFLIKTGKSVSIKSKLTKLIIPTLLLLFSLMLIKAISIKTDFGMPIPLNNPASISMISLAYFLFLGTCVTLTKSKAKERGDDGENQGKKSQTNYYEISI